MCCWFKDVFRWSLLFSRHCGWLSVIVAAPRCVCLLRRGLSLEGDTEGSSPLQHLGLWWAHCGCGGSAWRTSQDYQVLNRYFVLFGNGGQNVAAKSLLFPFAVTRFSTDEGQCWKSYNFTEQPFFFAGLASEPGTKAMTVSVWGFRPEEDGQPMWVTVTIDFQSLITRECESRCYNAIWVLWPILTWANTPLYGMFPPDAWSCLQWNEVSNFP